MGKSEILLTELLGERNRIDGLDANTPEEAIRGLLELLCEVEPISTEHLPALLEGVLAREGEATTGIGHGIAIPHMKNCTFVERVCGAFARTLRGVDFASVDGEKVRLICLILIPPGHESAQVQVMRKVARLARDGKSTRYLIGTPNFASLSAILNEVDEQSR